MSTGAKVFIAIVALLAVMKFFGGGGGTAPTTVQLDHSWGGGRTHCYSNGCVTMRGRGDVGVTTDDEGHGVVDWGGRLIDTAPSSTSLSSDD